MYNTYTQYTPTNEIIQVHIYYYIMYKCCNGCYYMTS